MSLHYEVMEAGEAVVFVHGALLDHHDWDVVAAQLAQSFQVLSYDRRTGAAEKARAMDPSMMILPMSPR